MQSSARTFGDRREAGRVLADLLRAHSAPGGVVVLGLARGGVPVAAEIATVLKAPLDVFVVRKLGAPRWPELAVGAIAAGAIIVNDDVVRGVQMTDAQLRAVIETETRELARREAMYGGPARPDVVDRTVVLTDDGIATGASMTAAVRAVRDAGAARVVVAAPVSSRAVLERLSAEADEVVVAVIPERFTAVGQVYADFHQVSDDEVRTALAR